MRKVSALRANWAAKPTQDHGSNRCGWLTSNGHSKHVTIRRIWDHDHPHPPPSTPDQESWLRPWSFHSKIQRYDQDDSSRTKRTVWLHQIYREMVFLQLIIMIPCVVTNKNVQAVERGKQTAVMRMRMVMVMVTRLDSMVDPAIANRASCSYVWGWVWQLVLWMKE